MNNQVNFAKDIKPDFYLSGHVSVFDSLFQEYEKVIFRSIITCFGLDIFIKDQYGGDVDTINNVRRISDDPQMKYKYSKNADAYETRGSYSHTDVEGKGTNYQRLKHEARRSYMEDPKANTVWDSYEDKPLGFLGKSSGRPTDKSAELDHVIAAKAIHDDRGRVLAGLSTAELADAEDNLKWTNEHLNKSMGANDIPDYIAAHPEMDPDTKMRMLDAYHQAKASYEDKLQSSYYYDFRNPQCRLFYKNCALSAGKRGLQMGLRQALGFLAAELWFTVKDKLAICKTSLKETFNAISDGLKEWSLNARDNYKEIVSRFGEGLIGGIISSFTTTITNIFLPTTENVTRIIRQAWASVVEATSELFFNTKEKYFCDRMTTAAKVLASGASVIIGISVQQTIRSNLSALGINADLNEILCTFAGSLCTGFLSLSLLFYIDNNPFNDYFTAHYSKNTETLRKQGEAFKKYCAELENLDTDQFKYATDRAYQLSMELDRAEGNEQMNKILRTAVKDLGLPILWGEGSLADRIKNDPTWVLRF